MLVPDDSHDGGSHPQLLADLYSTFCQGQQCLQVSNSQLYTGTQTLFYFRPLCSHNKIDYKSKLDEFKATH